MRVLYYMEKSWPTRPFPTRAPQWPCRTGKPQDLRDSWGAGEAGLKITAQGPSLLDVLNTIPRSLPWPQ